MLLLHFSFVSLLTWLLAVWAPETIEAFAPIITKNAEKGLRTRSLVSYGRVKRKFGREAVVLDAKFLTITPTITQVGGRILAHGVTTFLGKWKTYSLIPLIAGFVGWLTNYLAVKMLFYPISWTGIPLLRKEGQPLGFLGWQGIVPAKTVPMTEAMVNATITELLSIEEIIQRLEPIQVANILLPQASSIIQPVVEEITQNLPTEIRSIASKIAVTDWWFQRQVCRNFLIKLTRDVQSNIESLLNLRDCVVNQMVLDKTLLGKLFLKVGNEELRFLTDSGLWFGFLLGILQLIVSLYWDNPWILSVGGLIVGLATNWLALKWIFEPVNPKKIGPFVLQGLFLRRQEAVSADFAKFFATQVLTSNLIWKSILTDPTTSPEFAKLFAKNILEIVRSSPLGMINTQNNAPNYSAVQAASKNATDTLFQYLTDLHPYVDKTLNIEETLRTRMSAMTSESFERVLHPIFEEDETTLILSGGGLGFLAGLLQQALTSGTLILPRFSLNLAMIAAAIFVFKPRKKFFSYVQRFLDRTSLSFSAFKKRLYSFVLWPMGNSTDVEA